VTEQVASKPAHEIVWKLGKWQVEQEVVCNLPTTAPCHMLPLCDCESASGVFTDEDGTYHEVEREDGDEWVIERHNHAPNKDCNYCLFLNGDPQLIPELWEGTGEVVIGRTPITPVWGGDDYSWKVAE
jgi:hypothetical protein